MADKKLKLVISAEDQLTPVTKKAATVAAADLAKVAAANKKVGDSSRAASVEVTKAAKGLGAVKASAGGAVSASERLNSAWGQLKGTAGAVSAVMGSVAASATAAWQAFSFGADTAGQAERQFLRLESQVRQTGGAAGFTADELDRLARTEGLATLGNVEPIRDAIGALTTFKSISGPIFEETIRLSGDVAEVFGQDIKSSAIQLGKALENPTEGLSALARVGVTFTNAEQEKIKALQKSGDLMGAQRVILDVLTAQFGGAGRAAAQGYAGAVDTLGQRWDELKESMGAANLPQVTEYINKTAEALHQLALPELTAEAAQLSDTMADYGQRLAAVNEATGAGYQTWMEASLALGAQRDAAEQAGYALLALDDAGKSAAAQADQLIPVLSVLDMGMKALDKSAAEAGKTLEKSLNDMGAAASALDQAIAGQLPVTLAAIESSYAERLDIIETGNLSEQEKIRQTADLVRETEAAKLAAVNDNYSQRAEMLTATFDAEMAMAAQAGLDTLEIEKNKLAALAELDGERAAAYRSAIDALVGEEKRLNEQARALRGEVVDLAQNQADYERELRREGLSEYGAYVDKRREIAERNSAAEKAIAEGNFQAAKDYAAQALALVKQNDAAVKDGSQTVVSAEVARRNALEDSRAATDILKQATEAQAAAAEQAAAKAGALAGEFKDGLAGVQEQAAGTKTALDEALQADLKIKTDKAQADLQAFLDITAQKEALVDVRMELSEAQAALTQFAEDPRNTELAIEARLALETISRDADLAGGIIAAIGDEKINAQADFTAVVNGANDARAGLAEILEVPTVSAHSVEPDTSAAQAAIGELQQTTHSTHIIHVQRVEGPSQETAPVKKARGGSIPGYGGGDKVPALLEAGEFVIRKEAVKAVGTAELHKINSGVRRFATGGLVNPGADCAASAYAARAIKMRGLEQLGTSGLLSNAEITYLSRLRYEQGGCDKNMTPAVRAEIDALLQADTASRSDPLAHLRYDARKQAESEAMDREANRCTPETIAKRDIDIKRLLRRPPDMMTSADVTRLDSYQYDQRQCKKNAPVKKARGGSIPGYGGGDKVPALLEAGEFVIRKEAVKAVGTAELHKINSGVRRFATGGLVPSGGPKKIKTQDYFAAQKESSRLLELLGEERAKLSLDGYDPSRFIADFSARGNAIKDKIFFPVEDYLAPFRAAVRDKPDLVQPGGAAVEKLRSMAGSNASFSSPAIPSQARQAAAPAKTVELKFNIGGKTVSGSFREQDAEALATMLQDISLRM